MIAKPTISKSLQLDPQIAARLRTASASTGRSQTAIINEAIAVWLLRQNLFDQAEKEKQP